MAYLPMIYVSAHDHDFIMHGLQVFQLLGGKAEEEVTASLLRLRDDGGLMGSNTPSWLPRSLALLSLSGTDNETTLVEEWLDFYLKQHVNIKCQPSSFPDLVYILWTMANVGRPPRPDIFECVHSHSDEMLSSPEVQYHLHSRQIK